MSDYINLNPLYESPEFINKLAHKVVNIATNDNGLKGKVLRYGNGMLDVGKAAAVSATPPMPSLDNRAAKSIADTISSARGDHSARRRAAVRLGRTIKHPVKTFRRFLDRTVTGAGTDMPMLIMPGHAGPNPFYGVANGTTPKQIYQYMGDTVNYVKGGMRNYANKAKSAFYNGVDRIRNSTPLNLKPSY